MTEQTVNPETVAIEEIEHTLIGLSDGTQLAARIWRPVDAEASPVPALLEYLPYRKSDQTAVRDSITHPAFAERGYACVRVDLRGSGDSEGVLTDEYLEQELRDGEEVIAWIAAQPWCDGEVGLFGKSWGGINGLQLAARRPPALAAVVSLCSSDDRYADDVHYMGGCLLGDNLSWASVMFVHNACPPDPRHVGERWRAMWHERLRGSGLWLETWLRHPRRDAYWRRGSVCEDYDAIACPVLAVSGWADGYSSAALRLARALPGRCRALIGPWSHEFPHFGAPGPPIDFIDYCTRFWDRWLKGRGGDEEPPVRVWMQDACPPRTQYEERPGRWVAENAWPSPRIERWALGLTDGYGLVPTRPGAFEREHRGTLPLQSPLSVGLFAGKWCSYNAPPDLPGDQREEDGGALVFETAPLAQDVELLGAPEVTLTLRSSEPVAQIAARLSSVAPDRQATRITYGLLNLTHRRSDAAPEPVPTDAPFEVTVQLNDCAQRFPAGYRVRLSLSSSYFPLAWPAPRSARLTVAPEDSVLSLPVRPPRGEDAALVSLGAPPRRAALPTTQLAPARYRWRVLRDLGEQTSTLEVVKDEGRIRFDGDGLEYARDEREWYTFVDDDYDSVQGQTRGRRAFARGDWRVEVRTWTELRSDPERFRLRASLAADEADETVFEQTWELEIPREDV